MTSIEVIIVMLIVLLLAVIAIPNYVKARGTAAPNACINNLRVIDGGKQQWALEKKKSAGSAVVDAEVNEFFKKLIPLKCPSGGSYTYGVVGDLPTCNIDGHTI